MKADCGMTHSVLNKKRICGVTMAELLISLNIICLTIFIMAATLCMLMRSSQKNIDNSSAYIVADSVMKTFLAQNRENIGKDPYVGGYNEESTKLYAKKKFSYSLDLSEAGENLYYIIIKVTEIDSEIDNSDGKSETNAVISTLVNVQ